MMFSVSTLFLAALVFNAASTFGAPLRIPDTSSVAARSEDSSIAARAPVVEKRPVQVVSERGTPLSAPPAEVKPVAREESQLIRRYPRKVYYDFYEKREPEPKPAITIKESTVKTTKVTTYDNPADAAAAKALSDSVSSTVISSFQTTTTIVSPPTATSSVIPTPSGTDVPIPTTTGLTASPSGVPSSSADPANPTPTPTGSIVSSSTETSTIPAIPAATGTSTSVPTPSGTDVPTPSGTVTSAPTASGTGVPTPAASGLSSTVSPAPTSTGSAATPSGTPDHLGASHASVSPSSTDGTVKPTGVAQRDLPQSRSGPELLARVDEPSPSSLSPPSIAGNLVSGNGNVPSAANLKVSESGVARTLSGRQLASSGATLASAMKRRDLSSSNK